MPTRNPVIAKRPKTKVTTPPHRKKGKVPKSIRKRTPEQARLLRAVRHYQARMAMRVAVGNQIDSMKRLKLAPPKELEAFSAETLKPMESAERKLIHRAAKAIQTMPVWTEWLSKVTGIAENLATQFIAHIAPVGDFPVVSKLWAYAGLAVKDGAAVRHHLGVKSSWNPQLKTLCYQAATCFERCGGPYRELYDRYKERDRAVHPKKQKALNADGATRRDRFGKPIWNYTDGHMRNRALRYCVKQFLADLWQVWRELEGLPTRGPYPIEYLGHTTLRSPWAMIESESQHANEAPSRNCEPRLR